MPNDRSWRAAQRQVHSRFSRGADITVLVSNDGRPVLLHHVVPGIEPPPEQKPQEDVMLEGNDPVPDPCAVVARNTSESEQLVDVCSTDMFGMYGRDPYIRAPSDRCSRRQERKK